MPAPEAAAGGGGGAAAEGGKGGQGSARFGDSKPVTAEFVSCWEDQRCVWAGSAHGRLGGGGG